MREIFKIYKLESLIHKKSEVYTLAMIQIPKLTENLFLDSTHKGCASQYNITNSVLSQTI